MLFLAQIIGSIAVAFWVVSIQVKERKNVLLFQSVANFLYFVVLLLLKIYSSIIHPTYSFSSFYSSQLSPNLYSPPNPSLLNVLFRKGRAPRDDSESGQKKIQCDKIKALLARLDTATQEEEESQEQAKQKDTCLQVALEQWQHKTSGSGQPTSG